MADHRVVSRESWLAERQALLEREKAFDRERDALSAARRALPSVEVEDYRFVGPEGEVRLSELFGGCSQLVVQHFMYGADWPAGCPSCSFWADGFDPMAVHLRHRDTGFCAVSIAPIEQLLEYRNRMGWRFPWVSSAGTSFNRDFGVTFSEADLASGATYNYGSTSGGAGEHPGVSVFVREGERLLHTYSTYARGLDHLNAAYHLLDLVPKGRDEAGLPWTQAWVQRHDEY
jgi:predicted dithiol-disulfide oxidoreductase (DUF899 family)